MEFGAVTRFLKAHPDADRVLLLREIASGVFPTRCHVLQRSKSSSATEYLHMNGIIHGDLQGVSFVTSTRTKAS